MPGQSRFQTLGRSLRIIIPFVLALICLFALRSVVSAQEPDDWYPVNSGGIWWGWYFPRTPVDSGDSCTDGTDDNCQAVNLAGAFDVDSYQNFYLPVEASAIRVNASKSAGGGIDFGVTDCGHIGNAPGDYTAHSWTSTITCTSVLTSGWHTVYWANNSSGSNTTVYSITMEYFGAASPGEGEGQDTCPLVQNANFAADYGGWTLTGTAILTNGALTLWPLDTAQQNLFLQAGTPYSAVISVTNVVDPPFYLEVELGEDRQDIFVEGTGLYSTTFTTGELNGPILYTLRNGSMPGGANLDIDFTCLYPTEASDQRQCLAPTNGSFDTPEGWNFYRGASHNPLAGNAYLPYNSDDAKSLLISSQTYTMPTLITGTYLIFAFDALSGNGQNATLNGRVGTVESLYDVYAGLYTFQTDISHLAGETVDVSFANSGSDDESFPAIDDVVLDNVCIYLSDTPPSLPGPSDGGFKPVNFGWNFGCADVSAILAGLGINVYYLEELYAAGVSVWDFANWVPWLAAALWVNAIKPLSCLLVTMFSWFIGAFEYLINQGLNWGDWIRRCWTLGAVWLNSWWLVIYNLGRNWSNFVVSTCAGWLIWLAVSAKNVWVSLWANMDILGRWIHDGVVWLGDWLWDVLASVFPSVLDFNLMFDFATAVFNLFWMLLQWIWANVFMVLNIPVNFYMAFDAGVRSNGFSLITCDGEGFWCAFLAGVQLVNQSSSQSVVYPAVIVGIYVLVIIDNHR